MDKIKQTLGQSINEPCHEKNNVVSKQVWHRAVQAQKMARGLKFWIWKVEELYYLCSENKGADQLCFVCAFVFICAKYRFSHDVAQFSPLSNRLPHVNALANRIDLAIQ